MAQTERTRSLLTVFTTKKELYLLLITTALYHAPARRSGFDLHEKIKRESGGFVGIAQGHLYPLLHQWEREGFLRSEWERHENPNTKRKRLYSFTDAGVRRYQELKASLLAKTDAYLRFMNTVVQVSEESFLKKEGNEEKVSLQS
ncbi:PadR family transcriptional regulator, partial [Cytobacillus sp. FJAT-54145]